MRGWTFQPIASKADCAIHGCVLFFAPLSGCLMQALGRSDASQGNHGEFCSDGDHDFAGLSGSGAAEYGLASAIPDRGSSCIGVTAFADDDCLWHE
jgi:hypothetical protein